MTLTTDKAYLLGLLVGGGVISKKSFQIILPYKKWGDLKINPERAGEIASDILSTLNPIWSTSYGIDVAYKIGTNWKITSKNIKDELLNDLKMCGLPTGGEMRDQANLEKLLPYLRTLEHKKYFLTGLIDTIGSLAKSHRRFVDDFQIVSFEFKSNNFRLVQDVLTLLESMGITPDQVLWNHPNQHAGQDRYYKQWKKGFKIRLALEDYMLQGGFVFKTKKLSAQENSNIGDKSKTTKDKIAKLSGRVSIHKDQNSDWLPNNIRGYVFVHNLQFNEVLGLATPKSFPRDELKTNFHQYFCPFTCLTKGSKSEISMIIAEEAYLEATTYNRVPLLCSELRKEYEGNARELIFGNTVNDGFPVNLVLQGLAYVIAATTSKQIKGKRVLGNFIDLIQSYSDDQITHDLNISIKRPDQGTCLLISNNEFAALVGYVNDDFNKSLLEKVSGYKFKVREPSYKECIKLNG